MTTDSPQSSSRVPLPNTAGSWVSDFLRTTLMDSARGSSIVEWARSLVEALAEAKPDHEAHVIGVSRIPRTPNYLLASSTEKMARLQGPLPITLTKQTADLFLAPVNAGIRLLQGELPMSLSYTVDEASGLSHRQDFTFYEAIAFDARETSIVLALVLPDSSLAEFLPQEELAELHPMARSHAIPLLELYQLRVVKGRLEDELQGMLQVVRESNPELGKITIALGQGPIVSRPGDVTSKLPPFEVPFVQHLVSELRQANSQVAAATSQVLDLANTTVLNPTVVELAKSIHATTDFQAGLLRNMANLVSLALPDVRPKRSAFSLQSLLRDLFPIASEVALRYEARAKLEENTRNLYVSVDPDTIVKMFERLVEFVAPACAGGTMVLRSDDSTERAGKGMVLIELEDSGEFPRDVPPSQLLDRNNLVTLGNHPRLRRGGGVLFQVLVAYFDKCGGNFRLGFGPGGGFSSQVFLPLASRSEAERSRGGDTRSAGSTAAIG